MNDFYDFGGFIDKYPELRALLKTPEEMAELRAEKRAEMVKEFNDVYPPEAFDNSFLYEWERAKRDEEICKTCTGYPCKKKSPNGMRTHAYYNKMSKSMCVMSYNCEYRKRFMEERRAVKELKLSAIPKKYIGKTLAHYKVDENNRDAVEWAKSFLEGGAADSLYFYGRPGTGKTFLASIIAQELMKQGKTVIFSDVPALLTEIKRTFKEENDATTSLIERLCKIDVLFLDDIGTENVTEWAVEQLYMIINSRYAQELPTVYTSNYSLNELVRRLNAPNTKVQGLTGDRIASRIYETAKKVEFKGADRRMARGQKK